MRNNAVGAFSGVAFDVVVALHNVRSLPEGRESTVTLYLFILTAAERQWLHRLSQNLKVVCVCVTIEKSWRLCTFIPTGFEGSTYIYVIFVWICCDESKAYVTFAL